MISLLIMYLLSVHRLVVFFFYFLFVPHFDTLLVLQCAQLTLVTCPSQTCSNFISVFGKSLVATQFNALAYSVVRTSLRLHRFRFLTAERLSYLWVRTTRGHLLAHSSGCFLLARFCTPNCTSCSLFPSPSHPSSPCHFDCIFIPCTLCWSQLACLLHS